MQAEVSSGTHSTTADATAARGTRRLPLRFSFIVAGLLLLICGVLVLLPKQGTPAAASMLAPDFTLPAVSGAGNLSLHGFRGHPVVINFFNSQCGPCLDELPELRQAARAYASRGVVFLGVATGGDTLTTARTLAVSAHLQYPIVVDTRQDAAWRYYVGGWPTSFFVDAGGRLRGEYVGPLDAQTLRNGLAQVGAVQCTGCETLPQPMLLTNGQDAGVAHTLDADYVYKPAAAAPSFTLRDQQGRIVTPQSLHGKVVALTFISALCKQQCPLVGKALNLVRAQLGRDAGKVEIVAISVEPEVDTPEATRAFAAESGWQGTTWHYLTAPRSTLAPIWKKYGIYVENAPPIFKPGQSIQHQAYVFLIDTHGALRALYDVPFLSERITNSIKALL